MLSQEARKANRTFCADMCKELDAGKTWADLIIKVVAGRIVHRFDHLSRTVGRDGKLTTVKPKRDPTE